MRFFNDCSAKGARLRYRSIERAHLKPEQNTKTVRCRVPVAKVCMPVNVPGVKLENELAVLHNLLVFIAAMTALATQQLLVPAAAVFHIAHGDQGLSFHWINPVLALPYSITSSARASSAGGSVRPNAFAVPRLTMSRNVVA